MPEYAKYALPVGTKLREYLIEDVLGVGGFGITYLAEDTHLKRKVAIKEYFPIEIAWREENTLVIPKSEDFRESYSVGVERFLREARSLAQFVHPNIIQILNFFPANGTAYFVMNYVAGESLGEYLKREQKPLPEKMLLDIVFAVLRGLKAVHKKKILHRDIKPDNIYLWKDGEPMLIDFGASRYAIGHASSQSLTLVLTEGFAPYEQYQTDSAKQGPWTDIYALGATMYKAITLEAPPKAPDRLGMDGDQDPLIPAVQAAKGQYGERLLQAIDKCLAVSIKDRPQSVDELKALLTGKPLRLEKSTREVITRIQPAAPAAEPLPGKETRVIREPRPVAVERVFVKGGTFWMGEKTAFESDRKAHRVTLRDYHLSVTLVTNLQYAAFLNEMGNHREGGRSWINLDVPGSVIRHLDEKFIPNPTLQDHPVVNVTWYGARAFCEWVGGRLPSEAEWEFAARNRGKEARWAGTNEEAQLGEFAWYFENSGGHAHPVATKKANQLGLFDMSGNVGEWCLDWYDRGYYNWSPQHNPVNSEKATDKVIRGGSWNNNPLGVQTYFRGYLQPTIDDGRVGFRVAFNK